MRPAPAEMGDRIGVLPLAPTFSCPGPRFLPVLFLSRRFLDSQSRNRKLLTRPALIVPDNPTARYASLAAAALARGLS